MNLKNFILLPLDEVILYFEQSGYDVITKNNNFNVSGNKNLVTNITVKDKQCIITYGNFIFDI